MRSLYVQRNSLLNTFIHQILCLLEVSTHKGIPYYKPLIIKDFLLESFIQEGIPYNKHMHRGTPYQKPLLIQNFLIRSLYL